MKMTLEGFDSWGSVSVCLGFGLQLFRVTAVPHKSSVVISCPQGLSCHSEGTALVGDVKQGGPDQPFTARNPLKIP